MVPVYRNLKNMFLFPNARKAGSFKRRKIDQISRKLTFLALISHMKFIFQNLIAQKTQEVLWIILIYILWVYLFSALQKAKNKLKNTF